jgi:hypothetical protein
MSNGLFCDWVDILGQIGAVRYGDEENEEEDDQAIRVGARRRRGSLQMVLDGVGSGGKWAGDGDLISGGILYGI